MPITAFKPSVHGFKFKNSFSSEDIMEELYSVPSWMMWDNTWGLCGGMCFAALDRYFRQEPIPEQTNPPNRGDALFSELVKRLVDSIDSIGVNRIIDYQTRSDEEHWYELRDSLGYLSQSRQWPSIRDKIDAGIPTTLCLIRAGRANPNIGGNHQVVVYGYSTIGDKVTLNIYDPNQPGSGANDVVVTFIFGQEHNRLSAKQEPGSDPRGFIRVSYDRTERLILPAAAAVFEEEDLAWLWTAIS
jgi:hypothetical protein